MHHQPEWPSQERDEISDDQKKNPIIFKSTETAQTQNENKHIHTPNIIHQHKKRYGKHAKAQVLHLHLPIVNQTRSKHATTTLIKSGNAPVRDW